MKIGYQRSRRFIVSSVSAAGIVFLASSVAPRAYVAQSTQQRPEQQAASVKTGLTNSLLEVAADYRIGPGDEVEIQVDRAAELSGTYRVGSTGTFQMIYLGQITARDKTGEELVALITDGLRGRYLKNPHVGVVIRRQPPVRSTLFLQGAIRNPGVFQVEGRLSLLKLISAAGGLDKDHGSTGFIFREIEPKRRDSRGMEPAPTLTSARSTSESAGDAGGARYEMHLVNVDSLYKGDLSQDSLIEPGDIINIPPADIFFVAGEIRRPGSFPLREGTTASQAISLAEGTTSRAAGRAMILRVDSLTGKRVVIELDIASVLKGRNQDLLMRPNDILTVPNSRVKSALSVILNGLGASVRVPSRY